MRDQVFKRDRGRCAVCRKVVVDWDADHIVPVVEGGGECGLDGYRTLCKPHHVEATTRLRARLAKRVRSAKLTKAEWAKVFAARCQTKQGRPISEEDRALVDAAYERHPKKYTAMERDVFNATVPFGSSVRWK